MGFNDGNYRQNNDNLGTLGKTFGQPRILKISKIIFIGQLGSEITRDGATELCQSGNSFEIFKFIKGD